MKLIAIVDANFGIAKDGKIPWAFPEDLKFFQKKTEGSVVIMGRKTYFSIQNRPLKNRINCIISRTLKSTDNIEIFPNLETAYKKYQNAWIIGGEELYNQALEKKIITQAFITQIHKNYNADKIIKEDLLKYLSKNTIFKSNSYCIYEFC